MRVKIMMKNDEYYINYALKLAKKGGIKTSPNPKVGAIIVKNDIIVGAGYHKEYGGPHAEALALKMAGKKAKGATCYVTLEPCSHFGKTPPCADALIAAGIKRLVYISDDPNPKVSGKGIGKIKSAGISVLKSDDNFEKKEHELNKAWRYYIVNKRPFVTLKMGVSLDGKIATTTHESKWITSEKSRHDVQKLRSRVAAILTTADTVIADDPELTCRLKNNTHQPLRIVLDAHLRTDPKSKIYHLPVGQTLLCTKAGNDITNYKSPTTDFYFDESDGEHVDIGKLLDYLGEKGITSLMIEAGGRFADVMLRNKYINEICWYIAPIILGGGGSVSTEGGVGFEKIIDAPSISDIKITRLGEDIKITGKCEVDI